MKRKQVEEELDVLKKKSKTLQSVCESLEADADKFAETASLVQEWQNSSPSRTP